MGRKIRKIGRKGKMNNKRRSLSVRKVKIHRIKSDTNSNPVIVFELTAGYQGVKGVKELAEIKKVTLNQGVYHKLKAKGGHLSIEQIREVLETPDVIYYDGVQETWFYVSGKSGKKVVVIIEPLGNAHRIATAHVISLKDFLNDVQKAGMKIIWEKD